MRLFRWISVSIFFVLCWADLSGPGAAQGTLARADVSSPMDVRAFQAELDAWRAAVDSVERDASLASERLKQTPSFWIVSAGGAQFRVSTQELRAQLARSTRAPKERAAALRELKLWLKTLQEEAASFAAEDTQPFAAQSKLREILSRAEFRGVSEPSLFQLFLARVRRHIFRFIEWLLGKVMRNRVGDYLVWGLLLILIALLLGLLIRSLRKASRTVPQALGSGAVPQQSWMQWIRRAEQAARDGDFRQAIHGCYWASVAWLEERGALLADPTRTPRESVRCLSAEDPRRMTFRGMTARMETTWYGYRAATREDFQAARAELEKLGCPQAVSPAITGS